MASDTCCQDAGLFICETFPLWLLLFAGNILSRVHVLFYSPWPIYYPLNANWHSSTAQQKWSLILFYSTRFIRPIYCLKVHWKFDLVLVAERDSGRTLSSAADAPYDGPYNSLPLLDLEFLYLQMTPLGLCYWSPCCFMLLKVPGISSWVPTLCLTLNLGFICEGSSAPELSSYRPLSQTPAPKLEFCCCKMYIQMNISLVSSVLVPNWILYHRIEVMIARLISSDIDGSFFFFFYF